MTIPPNCFKKHESKQFDRNFGFLVKLHQCQQIFLERSFTQNHVVWFSRLRANFVGSIQVSEFSKYIQSVLLTFLSPVSLKKLIWYHILNEFLLASQRIETVIWRRYRVHGVVPVNPENGYVTGQGWVNTAVNTVDTVRPGPEPVGGCGLPEGLQPRRPLRLAQDQGRRHRRRRGRYRWSRWYRCLRYWRISVHIQAAHGGCFRLLDIGFSAVIFPQDLKKQMIYFLYEKYETMLH